MNGRLLVSDPCHFRIEEPINPYMTTEDQPVRSAALDEHAEIVAAHRRAGRLVEHLPSDPQCPDMVFTANAALVRGSRAVLSNLPQPRRCETPHHRAWLESRGFDVLDVPHPFSGQGDALPCGNLLLAGAGWRTDERVHPLLARHLGYDVVPLHTVSRDWYDIDLAVAVIEPGRTVAYCPQALDRPSRQRLRDTGLDLIEVAQGEAAEFGLNLVSDGEAVTMGAGAPLFATELRRRGLAVTEIDTPQLRKSGGGVRCTSLSLDNP